MQILSIFLSEFSAYFEILVSFSWEYILVTILFHLAKSIWVCLFFRMHFVPIREIWPFFSVRAWKELSLWDCLKGRKLKRYRAFVLARFFKFQGPTCLEPLQWRKLPALWEVLRRYTDKHSNNSTSQTPKVGSIFSHSLPFLFLPLHHSFISLPSHVFFILSIIPVKLFHHFQTKLVEKSRPFRKRGKSFCHWQSISNFFIIVFSFFYSSGMIPSRNSEEMLENSRTTDRESSD
jgi:hypothetical protein